MALQGLGPVRQYFLKVFIDLKTVFSVFMTKKKMVFGDTLKNAWSIFLIST